MVGIFLHQVCQTVRAVTAFRVVMEVIVAIMKG